MAVQFFGQFLIARGEVDAAHIREALRFMERQNSTLGQLAVTAGLMQPRDVANVNATQRTRDIAFGDLCVEKRFMTASELVDLLRTQHEKRMPIGEALVALGHLESDRLALLLDVFKTEQAQYSTGALELPDALANHRAARPALLLFSRLVMRVAQIHTKLSEIRSFTVPPDSVDYRVSIPLQGVQGLDVALISDSAFATRLAVATTGLDGADLDPEMIADGIGEFLNVLLGNVVAGLSAEGHPMELGTPDYDAELADGWVADFVVDTGRAGMVLSLF